jgi:hypothetical protein
MQEQLYKLGVKTYTDTYYTQLTGGTPTMIGQDMPNVVGWIYGISIDVDGVLPTDQSKNAISLANASNLWLYFKVNAELFINNMRLDKLVFVNPNEGLGAAPAQYSNQRRYFDVNIPYVTDLKQSYYNNPTSLGTSVAPLYIPLSIYYIDRDSYNGLVKKGYLMDGVKALQPHPINSKHLKG